MTLVATWLSGIGLSHVIPSFKAAGIVSPKDLAELDLAYYEALGVTEPGDRRKLFYLVQRIKMAVNQDGDGEPMSHQKEVDEMLSQTLPSSKLILTEDDSLGDDDSIEVIEPPKQEPERRKSRRIASTRRSMTAVPSEETKENRRQKSAASRSRRTSLSSIQNGRTADPARGRPTRGSSKTNVAREEEEAEESDDPPEDDESDWKQDDEPVSSGDELPQRNVASRRTSRRLREKRMQRDSDTSFESQSSTQDEAPVAVATRDSRPRATSTGSSRQSTGQSATRRRSTSSTLDSDDESSSISEPTKRKTSIPMHRGRRYESKIQNPGASMRTGKQLSSIPSDCVAPMSPLVSLPVSRLEADISKLEKVAASRKSSTRSRSASLGSQSGSDSESGRTRTRSISGSDSETSIRRRSGRQSDDNGSAGPRRSLGGVDGRKSIPAAPQRASSLRNLGATDSGDGKKVRSRRSLPAGMKAKPENDLGPRASFVHGMAEDNSWGAQVNRIRSDNQAEHELFVGHSFQADDEEMRIRVIIRKRPMSNTEASNGKEIDVIHPLEYDGYGRILVYQPKTRVDLTKEIEQVPFAFDNVFDELATNRQIYERSVRNLVPGVFAGKWASVFAYGQTGSGKTYTMLGSNLTGHNAGNATNDDANLGLYYMAALDVFELARRPEYCHLLVGASLFEIYGGKLFDLLNDRKPVKCLENHRGKVCFPGLSEHPVSNANELMDVIETGAANRSTGCTSKNADSSRSHAVLQLSLRKDVGRQKNVEHGRLTFIDLAGSERGADTSEASRATRLEGAEINTSLLALKEVIRALATGDSMSHIPFRGSKLTQVLKESFVGKKSRSVMVACIAPNIGNCEHTLNTLRYADRVKERNPETGNLSANVVSASSPKRSRRLARASSVPVAIESSAPSVATYDDESESVYESHAESEAFQNAESEDDYLDDESFGDSDDLLDDLLRNTPHRVSSASLSNGIDAKPKSNRSEKSSESRMGRGKALEALVSTHRDVMTEMLGMVKVRSCVWDRDVCVVFQYFASNVLYSYCRFPIPA